MTLTRVAWSSLALIASLAAALVIKRRFHSTLSAAANEREMDWDLADDFTQAVANSLPHESGAFNIPPYALGLTTKADTIE
jgi:hypothetical protein